MLEQNSRYYDLKTAEFKTEDGDIISYKKRRFLPRAETMESQTDATVTEGERLDLMAARTFGDPEQFWRICDANNAMNPFELTKTIGEKLRIPSANTAIDFGKIKL